MGCLVEACSAHRPCDGDKPMRGKIELCRIDACRYGCLKASWYKTACAQHDFRAWQLMLGTMGRYGTTSDPHRGLFASSGDLIIHSSSQSCLSTSPTRVPVSPGRWHADHSPLAPCRRRSAEAGGHRLGSVRRTLSPQHATVWCSLQGGCAKVSQGPSFQACDHLFRPIPAVPATHLHFRLQED